METPRRSLPDAQGTQARYPTGRAVRNRREAEPMRWAGFPTCSRSVSLRRSKWRPGLRLPYRCAMRGIVSLLTLGEANACRRMPVRRKASRQGLGCSEKNALLHQNPALRCQRTFGATQNLKLVEC
ncbi:hypothetical protein [uncultured Nostoc sp.]|uniref:hypothetical protein n=1 Tax=uncultured Nostoc sp. TaxID=340711 RepID=UPI00260A3185|nr:hypothetical protein [uncultured Nostoc sp.]